jgi:hypothetical protein
MWDAPYSADSNWRQSAGSGIVGGAYMGGALPCGDMRKAPRSRGKGLFETKRGKKAMSILLNEQKTRKTSARSMFLREWWRCSPQAQGYIRAMNALRGQRKPEELAAIRSEALRVACAAASSAVPPVTRIRKGCWPAGSTPVPTNAYTPKYYFRSAD